MVVTEILEDDFLEAARTHTSAVHTGMAEPVVAFALAGVSKNAVGLGSFLEFFFGHRVSRIAVRVMLERELAVCAL